MGDVEDLIQGKVLLAEGFPVGDRVWRFHLHKDELIGHNPVPFNWNKVRVFEALECLDHLKCTTTLFLVQCRNVNARNHFICTSVLIARNENLAVTFAEVK